MILVSFLGPMGSGKTTAADYLVNEYGFVRVSFADALKDVVRKITPDGQIDKARDRALLQWLGTEYFRKLDPDYWVKQWSGSVTKVQRSGFGPVRVVVDDCRFPNEQEAVHNFGGYEFYLDVPETSRLQQLQTRDGVVATGIPGHASEQVLSHVDAITISNVYGLNSLYRQLTHHVLNVLKHDI